MIDCVGAGEAWTRGVGACAALNHLSRRFLLEPISTIEALNTMSIILYLNGTIYTMDAAQPRAQAMAIDNISGRILAVGDNDEVRQAAGRHAELVDLRGKTVLPGFIDSHIHLLSAAYRSYYIDAEACSG